MSDPHAHIVISYERFSEWRARRRLIDADLTPPPPPPPTNDADDLPPVPRAPRQPEATAWRQT
jgi:hypothetical protein